MHRFLVQLTFIIQNNEHVILHNISESETDGGSENEEVGLVPRRRPMIRPQNIDTGSSDKQWYYVTHNDPGPSHTIPIYNVSKGLCLPTSFDSECTSMEFFSLFFNDTLSHYWGRLFETEQTGPP